MKSWKSRFVRKGELVQWRDGRGVAVSNLPRRKGFATMYRVRQAGGKIADVEAVNLTAATVVTSSFPLNQLPTVVLAVVLFWLPMREAAEAACVSQRFLGAFRDNVCWRRRCVRDITNIDLEALFAAETSKSWMTIYDRNTAFRIEVVIVFSSRKGKSITGQFSMTASPHLTVASFLNLVTQHPENVSDAGFVLRPHEPSQLSFYDMERGERLYPDRFGTRIPISETANCSLIVNDLNATIAQAGLCHGAKLELSICTSEAKLQATGFEN